MTKKFLLPAALAATMAVSGLAFAQNNKNVHDPAGQPATKQSAPANAPDAQGHDAQTGKPATGETVQRKDAPHDQNAKAKDDKK